jgi:hypothetical protein
MLDQEQATVVRFIQKSVSGANACNTKKRFRVVDAGVVDAGVARLCDVNEDRAPGGRSLRLCERGDRCVYLFSETLLSLSFCQCSPKHTSWCLRSPGRGQNGRRTQTIAWSKKMADFRVGPITSRRVSRGYPARLQRVAAPRVPV